MLVAVFLCQSCLAKYYDNNVSSTSVKNYCSVCKALEVCHVYKPQWLYPKLGMEKVLLEDIITYENPVVYLP